MSHPKRPSVFLSYKCTNSDAWGQELAELMGKRHLRWKLLSMQDNSGWRDDPDTLKACVLLHQRLGEFDQSEPLLEQVYKLARGDGDRFFALTHWAVGFLRKDRPVSAYILALRAMPFDRASVTPWLIAAAAVGHIGDETVSKRFVHAFGQVFKDFRRFPSVVSALMTHPDLEAFVCSEPYLAKLEDRVCEAAEWLRLHGNRENTTSSAFSSGNDATGEELLHHAESRFPSSAHEFKGLGFGGPTKTHDVVRKYTVN